MTIRHSQEKETSNFLITGCQRSGTTLVAMALEAHPSIDVVEENDTRFHVDGLVTRELDLDAVSSQVAINQRLIGYKAPRDSHRMDDVAKMFPQIRVVWVERDIHQTVSSMLTLRTGRGSWADTYGPREISKFTAKTRDATAQQLFAQVIEMQDQNAKSVALAALCWMVKREQRYIATRVLGPRVLRVNYNELTANPGCVLRGLVDFLGLPWSPQVLDHPASIANVMRPGGTDPNRCIDVLSREKWKERLSHSDVEIIAGIKHSFERNFERSVEPVLSSQSPRRE